MIKDEEKKECTALEIRKREELELSIQKDLLADPLSATVIGSITGWQLLFTGASIGSSFLFSALGKGKSQRQQQGKMSGSLTISNAEEGIFIPEIYGAGPDISSEIVAGANPTWQNVTHCTTGANGSISKTSGSSVLWDAGATHSTSVTSGSNAFIRVILGSGPAAIGFFTGSTATQAGLLCGLYWDGNGELSAAINGLGHGGGYTCVVGDELTCEIRDGLFRLWRGFAEISAPNTVLPTPTYPLYMGFAGYGSGSGISNAKVAIGDIGVVPNAGSGGCKIPGIIVWTSGVRKHVTPTAQPGGGGKGNTSNTVDVISYDLDLGVMWCRGQVKLVREYANSDVLLNRDPNSTLPTGSYDGSVGADTDYGVDTLPDTQQSYSTPILRADAAIVDDPSGGDGGTGTIALNSSTFAVYPGDYVQLQDPTIQAAIDTEFGSGSTPAFRGRSLIVHTNFVLSRWNGTIPNLAAVWENKTLITLDTIFASFFPRVNLTSGDYDFTDIVIQCRGLLIAGRTFSPAEIIDSEEMSRAYNYFTTEGEGKVLAYQYGNEPILTIDESEIGWMDAEQAIPDIVESINGSFAEESTLEKEVDFRFISPDKDWEPGMQLAKRRITQGVGVKSLEIHATLIPNEAKVAAQRTVYFDYVSGTTRHFTLPWTYLYIYPGYKIIVNGDDGFTYSIMLTSMSGGIGVLDCEGYALEPAAFDQSFRSILRKKFDPNKQAPAMTVLFLWDGPLLRDSDDVFNDNGGIIAAGVPRTNSQGLLWPGTSFYIERNSVWSILGSSKIPATLGKVVTASSLSGLDPTVLNTSVSVTVDLYGTTATLESISDAEVTDEGKNLAIIGNLAFNFATAAQVVGYPNRWTLTRILAGVRETDRHLDDTFTDLAFLLIDGAVTFLPMKIEDLNNTYNFRAVTIGQSLDDAATISFPYTGGSLQRKKPNEFVAFFDEQSGNCLLEWSAPDFDATSIFDLEVTDGSGRTEVIKPDLTRHLQEYVIWDTSSFIGTGPPVLSDNGGVFLPDGHMSSLVSAEIVGGFLVEFEIPPTSSLPMVHMSIYPEGSTGTSADDALDWKTSGTFPNYQATPEHDFFGSTTPFIDISPGDRLSIYIRPDGIGEYHINYSHSSRPIWVSARKVDITKKYFVYVQLGNVAKTSWQRQGPEYMYLSTAQRLDNSLSDVDPLPDPIHARVRQRSSNTSGPASDWVEGVFNR